MPGSPERTDHRWVASPGRAQKAWPGQTDRRSGPELVEPRRPEPVLRQVRLGPGRQASRARTDRRSAASRGGPVPVPALQQVQQEPELPGQTDHRSAASCHWPASQARQARARAWPEQTDRPKEPAREPAPGLPGPEQTDRRRPAPEPDGPGPVRVQQGRLVQPGVPDAAGRDRLELDLLEPARQEPVPPAARAAEERARPVPEQDRRAERARRGELSAVFLDPRAAAVRTSRARGGLGDR